MNNISETDNFLPGYLPDSFRNGALCSTGKRICTSRNALKWALSVRGKSSGKTLGRTQSCTLLEAPHPQGVQISRLRREEGPSSRLLRWLGVSRLKPVSSETVISE